MEMEVMAVGTTALEQARFWMLTSHVQNVGSNPKSTPRKS
jgi:hypothetical protein